MRTAVWAVPSALGAAACFGVANVVQMRAARRTEASAGIDPRLLVRLFRDRWWLAGLLASAVGYGLQATALFLAPVVLVQPLIVTELLFALPLAAALAGGQLGRREWAGVGCVAGGLASFVLVANPSSHHTDASSGAWALMVGGVAAAVAVLVAVGEAQRGHPFVRASALALAASACFGLMSVLTRTVAHQFDRHALAALADPQPWLLAVAAFTGLLLAQTAFRIAPLSVSLPLIDLGEPVIGSLLAVTGFGEQIGGGRGTAGVLVVAGVLVALGVGLLDTSPLVRSAQRGLVQASG